MSIRSRLFALPMPGFIRKAGLSRLARLTAEAFGATYPDTRGQSVDACLERYAAFTSEQADILLRNNAPAARTAVEARLFSGARELGGRLRALLGIRNVQWGVSQEAMSAARAMYRMIGVDFECWATGHAGHGGHEGHAREAGPTPTPARFMMKTCFFSTRYSPDACRLISSLDAGLICGLTGGGRLEFTDRMTEGAAFCKGVIG